MKLIALAQSYGDAAPTLGADASKRVFPLLVRAASDALRAGARLSWDDYLALDQLERAAFAHAGDTLRAQEAQRVGVATSSLTGAAAVTAEYDDGEALEYLALEAIHAKTVAEA